MAKKKPPFWPVKSLEDMVMATAVAIADAFAIKVTISLEGQDYRHQVESDGREYVPVLKRKPEHR